MDFYDLLACLLVFGSTVFLLSWCLHQVAAICLELRWITYGQVAPIHAWTLPLCIFLLLLLLVLKVTIWPNPHSRQCEGYGKVSLKKTSLIASYFAIPDHLRYVVIGSRWLARTRPPCPTGAHSQQQRDQGWWDCASGDDVLMARRTLTKQELALTMRSSMVGGFTPGVCYHLQDASSAGCRLPNSMLFRSMSSDSIRLSGSSLVICRPEPKYSPPVDDGGWVSDGNQMGSPEDVDDLVIPEQWGKVLGQYTGEITPGVPVDPAEDDLETEDMLEATTGSDRGSPSYTPDQQPPLSSVLHSGTEGREGQTDVVGSLPHDLDTGISGRTAGPVELGKALGYWKSFGSRPAHLEEESCHAMPCLSSASTVVVEDVSATEEIRASNPDDHTGSQQQSNHDDGDEHGNEFRSGRIGRLASIYEPKRPVFQDQTPRLRSRRPQARPVRTTDGVIVAVRVRPPLLDREELGLCILKVWNPRQLDLSLFGIRLDVKFHAVHGPEADNREVYSSVAPYVECALTGQNVCVLADGQSGCGKSYTLFESGDCLAVQAARQLFQLRHRMAAEAVQVVIKCTLVESFVLDGKPRLRDLRVGLYYNDMGLRRGFDGEWTPFRFLDEPIESADEFERLIDQACGRTYRRTRPDDPNPRASDGHLLCLFTISTLSPGPDTRWRVSHLSFVDLAGHEREKPVKADQLGQSMSWWSARHMLADRTLPILDMDDYTQTPTFLSYCLRRSTKIYYILHTSPFWTDAHESEENIRFALDIQGSPSDSLVRRLDDILLTAGPATA
ncbi:hypothetical protein HRR78_008624 [Exophiala dermatitidis]|nr:hypothetical protein HRR75_000319 [Exophiala dermatitidis]KAJ4536185.1 hypothetical protein HRR78_008624 [Exophiala dermatitidis]